MLLTLALLQTAVAQPGTLPDLELDLRARARSVEIQQKGEARLEMRAEPDAGSRVEAQVTPRANGRTRLRNVEVRVHGEARLGAGADVGIEAGADATGTTKAMSETRQPD